MIGVSRFVWALIGFFLIGGVIFVLAIPEIFIGQIWIVVALFLGLFFWLLGRRAAKNERIKQRGRAGWATVLGVTQTNVQVNEQPVIELTLRVEAEGLEPFEEKQRSVVPLVALPSLSTGQPLPVYVDPDTRQVVIDWSIASGPMTISRQDGTAVQVTDPAQRIAILKTLQEHGLKPAGGLDLKQHPAARAAVLRLLEPQREQSTATAGAATVATDASGDETTVERLQELLDLKTKGLITAEEHDERKRQILSEI